jgi:hypothetical protein
MIRSQVEEVHERCIYLKMLSLKWGITLKNFGFEEIFPDEMQYSIQDHLRKAQ